MRKKISLSVVISMLAIMLPIVNSSAGSIFAGGDGTEENPYLISTQEQLEIVSDLPDSHFKLINDIEIDGKITPLCSQGEPFTGVFDGNGKTIRNLDLIQMPYATSYGMFAHVKGTIMNLNIIYSNRIYTSSAYTGGLVGYCSNGVIKNCTVQTDISGEYVDGLQIIGGLIGVADSSNVVGSSAIGSISSNSTKNSYHGIHLGGLIGTTDNSTISLCYADITSRYVHNYKIGCKVYAGFIAYLTNSNIDNCYSNGEYYIDIPYYKDTYSSDNSSETQEYVGGFTGYLKQGEISNSYSTSHIVALSAYRRYSGGIVGCSIDGTIINCYYDENLSGCSDTGKGVPKTTLGMKLQEVCKDWDFDTVWAIDENINDGYPYLRWQYAETEQSKLTITGAVSAEHQLGFIAESHLTGEDTNVFGVEFVPESLYNTSANRVKATYDASSFELSDGATFGAVLTNIPNGWEDVRFAGRAFAEKLSGEYIWSEAKSASINDTELKSVE